MLKIAHPSGCDINSNPARMGIFLDYAAIPEAMRATVDTGIGVLNWSGGLTTTITIYDPPNAPETFLTNDEFFCQEITHAAECVALDLMKQHNILMSSSAGNHRYKLQFPASEAGTVAVGGLEEDVMDNNNNLRFWNVSPNSPANSVPTVAELLDFTSYDNCPRPNPYNECSSNISHPPIDQKVDVVTQASHVKSTFYQDGVWAVDINCVDASETTPINDGYGYCTGTSMSAPQVSAILQLMRSTNPLLPNGTYDPNLNTGLINILNATASRSTSNKGLSDYFGYGLPNARLALEKILGKSGGVQMKTRLTPMFGMHAPAESNNVYTAFPQVAMAFMIYDNAEYLPDSTMPLVNEFTEFWYDHDTFNFPVTVNPRASFYVFTTNNNPFTGTKNLVPLRRMDKFDNGNRNDTYAVTNAEIESFHNNGYNYDGIEGYILPTCSPLPQCSPQGSTKLYRDETDAMNHKLVATNVAPLPNSTWLGFVYLNQDRDNDGLIDGQEIILGTNPNLQDTDGDGMNDGVEYPAAGVPFSDPLISDIIFKNGFD